MNYQHVPGKRLGKRAPRVDKRTLKMAKYLKNTLPVPPPEVSWIMEVNDWGMLGNDQYGDCVEACMMHMVQQWSRYAGTEIVPTTQETLELYTALTGFNPNDPNTDNGTDMLSALNYWRNTGITVGGKNHKILAYVQVDPTNANEVQSAIQLFGNVFTGLALPISAQDQSAWTVPTGGPYGDGSSGSWGGHCVPAMGRSTETVSVITWAMRLKMSHNFWLDYVDELYAVISTDWIESSGKSPGGFDLAQLEADLALV